MLDEKPKRFIDPVLKRCPDCPTGWVKYPDCVETLMIYMAVFLRVAACMVLKMMNRQRKNSLNLKKRSNYDERRTD